MYGEPGPLHIEYSSVLCEFQVKYKILELDNRDVYTILPIIQCRM